MKICRSCGKEFKGAFCEHCGYGDPNLKIHAADKYKTEIPVRFMTPEQKAEHNEKLKKKEEEKIKNGSKNKHDPKQIKILVIVAAAALFFILGTLYRSGAIGKKELNTEIVTKYFSAIEDRDLDSYLKCFPSEIKKELEEDLEATGYTKEQYMEALCEDITELCGDDLTIECDILNTKPLKEYSMEDYKAAYGTAPDISEAYVVYADVTFSGSKETQTYRYNCLVGKVGRHYKMFDLEYDPGIITSDSQ